ncbi:MAG TPA: DUF5615 family PIN-like protein [Acidobacteriota bacterium]|nr:DUF5615 family PIN-like protein [Acidobacteriota bacterium]
MRIFADENIPLQTIEALRKVGHDVVSAHDQEHKGRDDFHIWKFVQKESRVLITTDRGFANRRDELHSGILIVRLKMPNSEKIHQRIFTALSEFHETEWRGLLVIMRDKTKGIWKAKS